MKRIFRNILAIIILMFSLSLTSKAQIYIKICPKPPVYARPPQPHPNHVWVDGDWVYNGRTYVWREGYWIAPKSGHLWVPGHWKNTRRGFRWIPGHWRRHR